MIKKLVPNEIVYKEVVRNKKVCSGVVVVNPTEPITPEVSQVQLTFGHKEEQVHKEMAYDKKEYSGLVVVAVSTV